MRRPRRTWTRALLAVAPLLVLPSAGPARADATSGALGGFTGSASATPLRLEIHEQAIPVPADPEAELNLLYTAVAGDSGPTSSARASVLWPGAPVGEGFKTIADQFQLPSQLSAGGYPLQTNAASPAGPATASQNPLPGLTSATSATSTGATALAGLGSPPEDGSPQASASAGPSPTGGLPGFDPSSLLSGLTGALSGLQPSTPAAGSPSSSAGGAPGLPPIPNAPNPLGALSALVHVGSATSVSTTSFASDALTNRAVTKLGDISILGGIIHLDSVTVSATSRGTLDGAQDTPKVTYAGLTIGGQAFELNSDGVVAAGQKQPIPSLPVDLGQALSALGVSIRLPHAEDTVDGTSGDLLVRGPVLTIDTTPLRALLPSLPLSTLTSKFPAQAEQLSSLLLALNEAHPKVVVALGQAEASTNVVAPLVMPALSAPAATASATGSTSGTAGPAATPAAPAAGTPAVPTAPAPVAGAAPVTSAALQPTSAAPGLPPLGSVPGMLLYGGLVLAGAAGWWARRAGVLLLGSGAACGHGLPSGLPDLRKASS